MIAYLGNDDSTTRRMMEGILAMEEEHADEPVYLKKRDRKFVSLL